MDDCRQEAGTSSQFTCEQCGKIFDNLADFVTHKQLYQNVRHFFCELCDTIFEKLNIFTIHVRKCERRKRFACEECGESFNHDVNFRLHKVLHNNSSTNNSTTNELGLKLICPECHKVFTRLASYKCHLIMHRIDEILVCDECNEEFVYYFELQKHINVYHGDGFSNAAQQLLVCKQCDAVFKRPLDLVQHRITHKKIKDTLQVKKRSRLKKREPTSFVKCKFCEKSFTKQSSLDRHERIHTGEKPFACKVCNKSFNQKGSLMFHEAKHLTEKPFTCQLCGVGFAQRGNLRTHVKRVHPVNAVGRSSYQCPLCPCVMRSLQSLNAHLSKRHNDALKVLNAGDGSTTKLDALAIVKLNLQGQFSSMPFNETFVMFTDLPQETQQQEEQQQTAEEFVQAVIKSKSSNNRPFKLTSKESVHDGFCGSNIRGIRVRDKRGRNVWQCPYCPRELIRSSDLVRHVRVHTGEKPYKCTVCTKGFALRTTRDQHVRTHFQIKPMRCYICFKELSTSYTLKAHMRIHRNEALECQKCGKRFRTKAHLNTHWRRMHEGDVVDVPLKVFTDSLADARKSIKQQNSMRKPSDAVVVLEEPLLQTATGLVQLPSKGSYNDLRTMSCVTDADGRLKFRPYACDYCPLRFTKNSLLTVHKRSHTGEKPYQCFVCNRHFGTSTSLKNHLRIHTGVKTFSCDRCSKLFRTRQVLQRHRFVHTEERPFVCPYCGKKFRRGVLCRRHIKTHQKYLEMQLKQQQLNAPTQDVVLIPQPSSTFGNNTMPPSSYPGADQNYFVDNNVHHNVQQTTMEVWPTSNDQQQRIPVVDQHNYVNVQHWNQQQQAPAQQCIEHHNLTNFPPNNGPEFATPNQNNQDATIAESPCLDQFSAAAMAAAFSPNHLENIMNVLDAVENGCDANLVPAYQQGHVIGPGINQTYQFLVIQPEVHQGDVLLEANVADAVHRVCSICCQSFVTDAEYQRHLNMHQQGQPVVESQQQPSSSFQTPHASQQTTVTGHHDHVCAKCSAVCSSSLSLNRHMRVVHKEQLVKYACPVCNKQFTKATQVTRHIFNVHRQQNKGAAGMVEDVVQTDQSLLALAEPGFWSENLLNAEVAPDSTAPPPPPSAGRSQRKLNMTGQLAVCDVFRTDTPPVAVSRYRSVSPNAASTTVGQVNASVEKPLDTIGGSLYDAVIVQHANFGTSGSRRQCPNCPKSFKKPSDLARHIRCHTGEKPFTCDQCGRNFRVKSTLIAHKKTHIANNASSMHKCQVCNKDFASRGSLKVHFRLHTNERPYTCAVCSESFRSSAQMKHHVINVHQHDTIIATQAPSALEGTSTVYQSSALPMVDSSASTAVGSQQLLNNSNINIFNPPHHSTSTLTCAETSAFTPVVRQGVEYRQDVLLCQNDEGAVHGSAKVALQILQDDNNLQLVVKNFSPQEPIDANTVVVDVTFLQDLAANGLTLTIPVSFVETPGLDQQTLDQAAGTMTTLTVNPLEILQHTNVAMATSVPSHSSGQSSSTSAAVAGLEWTPSVSNKSNSVFPETTANDEVIVVDVSKENYEDNNSKTKTVNNNSGGTFVVECQVCNLKFANPTDSRRHFASGDHETALLIADGKQQTHLCTTCGKSFPTLTRLRRHVVIHTGHKPYSCSVCGDCFSQKNTLKKHYVARHTSEKKHKCLFCSKLFTHKYNMRKHVQRAHPNCVVTVDEQQTSSSGGNNLVTVDSEWQSFDSQKEQSFLLSL